MKTIFRSLVLFFVILAVARADRQPTQLMVFRDPLVNYVEAIRVVSVTQANSFYVTVLLPNGQSQQYKAAGVLGWVKYPPASVTSSLVEEGASAIDKINGFVQQFPQIRNSLQGIQTQWTNALSVAKQLRSKEPVSAASSQNVEQLTFTTVDGTTFTKVSLLRNDTTGISIGTESGIAHITYERLPKNLQKRFNYVSPEEIAKAKREKEEQLQRDRDAQARREKEAKAQQEKEMQVQRDKELQVQRDKNAQAEREKAAQAQKDKEAQLQREKEAQAQRVKDEQLQKEREAQIQREKGLEQQKEQARQVEQARLQREKEALVQQEKEIRLYAVIATVAIASHFFQKF